MDARRRLDAIRADLASLELNALVVGQQHNRRYLTGFTGSSGLAVVTGDAARLLTDSRYFEQAEREAPEFGLERIDGNVFERLAGVLSALGAERVGFEADSLSVSEYERYRSATPGVTWVATSALVEKRRAVKCEDEIELLRQAARLTDRAIEHVAGVIRPGITERSLAWQLERFMRENGAEALSFEPIVASGENSAQPHHRPSDRLISAGEPIVIDIGAQLNGYCGDLTRTFSIGPCRYPEYEQVYRIVDLANRTAIAGIQAGKTGPQIDALARDVIAGEGFGDCFGHGLGHGVGLNIHELPRLSRAAGSDPLVEGMVATVEPGIYVEGSFGVRIEDVVVVRANGAEVLTGARKQPVVEI